MPDVTCSVDDCEKQARSRGYCPTHYTRWRRQGDPTLTFYMLPKPPPPTCSIDGCEGQVRGRGWCKMHWQRWSRHGDPLVELKVYAKNTTAICIVDGCADRPKSQNLCTNHYYRQSQHGDPLAGGPPRPINHSRLPRSASQSDRFWQKVDKSDTCWVWTGALLKGYGQAWYEGKLWLAHRLSWVLAGKYLDPDLTLDHLCRNPPCVNPSHLEQVTGAENTRRGLAPSAMNARKTHCKRGHEFNETNTRRTPSGGRACRACGREDSAVVRRRARGIPPSGQDRATGTD